jgi:hypothetical protein
VFKPDVAGIRGLPDVSEQYVGDRIQDLGQLSHEFRIALGWTAYLCTLQDEIRAMAAHSVPLFRYAAVGFLDEGVDRDYRRNQYPPFGVILYADAVDGRDWPLPTFDPIQGPDNRVAFPVVVRRGTYELQVGAPKQPPAAQVACWATTRGGQYQGWLTADHATAALGGIVMDRAGDCTDAALVDIGVKKPSGSVNRSAYTKLAPSLKTQLCFHHGVVSATVLDVSIDFEIFLNPRFPMRFSLDDSGIPGNSGALVTEASTGDPLGVYLGRFLPWTAKPGQKPSGFALAAYQLEKMMDMEVFL